jgi:hypothetical protein
MMLATMHKKKRIDNEKDAEKLIFALAVALLW